MIDRLSHASIWVTDQDEAKAFYTEKLGLEVRTDETMDGFRWVTVGTKGQPDLELTLLVPGPPMFDEETAAQVRSLVEKGNIGGGVWATDDCRATFEELSLKGVEFLQEPADRPYGVEAVLRVALTHAGVGR